MRQIDADALKKTLNFVYGCDYIESKSKEGIVSDIIDEIDNAPTVEPEKVLVANVTFDKEQLQEIVDKAVAKLVIDNKRPQGEWIYGEDDCGQDGWFCSKCGFFVPWYYQYYEKDIDFIRDYKACPHCISEMVTYTGKDRDLRGEEE